MEIMKHLLDQENQKVSMTRVPTLLVVLAGLATAVFLIRDGQMKGENIHILKNSRCLAVL